MWEDGRETKRGERRGGGVGKRRVACVCVMEWCTSCDNDSSHHLELLLLQLQTTASSTEMTSAIALFPFNLSQQRVPLDMHARTHTSTQAGRLRQGGEKKTSSQKWVMPKPVPCLTTLPSTYYWLVRTPSLPLWHQTWRESSWNWNYTLSTCLWWILARTHARIHTRTRGDILVNTPLTIFHRLFHVSVIYHHCPNEFKLPHAHPRI